MVDLIDELIAVPEEEEAASAADYTGSLSYIDSLASRRPILSVSKTDILRARDASAIANASFDDLDNNPQALPHDNRRFNPMSIDDPGELTPGSSRLVERIATPEEPYLPHEIEKIIRSKGYEEANKSIFRPKDKNRVSFNDPFRTYICVKRRIRREIMHAFGFSGRYYKRRRITPFMFVRC